MKQADYRQAQQYALKRLEHELAPALTYHSLFHTRDDVMPAVACYAGMEGLSEEDTGLVCTAAAFHDIGFVERYANHEIVGIRIAAENLPRFGFTQAQIQVVLDIILATRLPQTPFTLLEQIMADSDLDVFGRDDFFKRNNDLRTEQGIYGQAATDAEWWSRQLKFLGEHTYFTRAARAVRGAQKQQHLEEVETRLRSMENGVGGARERSSLSRARAYHIYDEGTHGEDTRA